MNKRIYLNLKRFDVPKAVGGVNNLAFNSNYPKMIVNHLNNISDVDITIFFQEAYLISAVEYAKNVKIGCQSVFYDDVKEGENFGAFTSFRTAKSMTSLNINDTLIGHCEERNHLNKLKEEFGGKGDINQILNKQIKCAVDQKMNVLYCIGEKAEEQEDKYNVLKNQLLVGLKDIDLNYITIAYEPVWAIGPGKTPPDETYIDDIAKNIKSVVNCPVVYGGGLKQENAKMIASIKSLDGGLIALTRFGKDFGFYLSDFDKIVDTYLKGL